MKKILVVEDDTLLMEMLSQKFKKDGFSVRTCMDGQSGLEMAKEEKPDIILMDNILPVMSGPEMFSYLRKDPDLRSIPVVMLSNVGSNSERLRILSQGIEKYLVKYENTLNKIVGEVEEVLKKK